MNGIQQRIRENGFFLGSWVSSGSPSVAEMLASLGFDFLTIDIEHSPINLPQAHALFQAIKAGNPDCAPLVRLSGVDYAETKRYLDAGAIGVIAPLVNTPAQAEQVVKAVKYPPLGERGLGFVRANMYGLQIDGSTEIANERLFTCIQIEHTKGVENIDAILSVPGLDAVFIGPYDLSASLGLPGDFNHPVVVEAMEKVLHVCINRNIIAGIHVVQPDVKKVIERIDQGYRMIAFSLDLTMMANTASKALKELSHLSINASTKG